MHNLCKLVRVTSLGLFMMFVIGWISDDYPTAKDEYRSRIGRKIQISLSYRCRLRYDTIR
jgi:hypothetical protein